MITSHLAPIVRRGRTITLARLAAHLTVGELAAAVNGVVENNPLLRAEHRLRPFMTEQRLENIEHEVGMPPTIAEWAALWKVLADGDRHDFR